MKPSRETLVTGLLLLALLVASAAALSPELSITRADLNDNVFHFTLVERMVQAMERGENPLDCWSPEWEFGYPVLRTYQPLAHVLVALVYFALGKSVGLMTVFVWVRYLALALLPLSFFAAARLMGMARWPALAAALLAPLVSATSLYGIDYGSFTWAGSGLFPQLVATHLLLFTLGFGCRAMRRGRGLTLAGALLALTFLAHLIYGYMGAIGFCLMAAVPDRQTPLFVRLQRLVWTGAAAVVAVAFQLVPMLRDGATINHSRWEPVWKWDSFGAPHVALLAATGQLLDSGRVPVMSLLALAGAVRWYWKRDWLSSFAVLGAAFWLLMFCGRPLWGPVLLFVGVMPDMHLHRVIGGAQIFLVLLAALALVELWNELVRRWRPAVAVAALALLFLPMVWDRATNLTNNATWGETNLAANTLAKPDIDATLARVEARGGRAYAGLASGWGNKFRTGDIPLFAYFSSARIPAVAFLYHAMALTGDIMERFDQTNEAQYRLFNIRSVVGPASAAPTTWPPFLRPRERFGPFQLFDAPGNGYFDLVDVPASVKTTRLDFFDVNDRWLHSGWVAQRQHLWLDWRGDAPAGLVRAPLDGNLPGVTVAAQPAGEIRSERRTGEVYQTEFDAARDCYALFKMTWHRNWTATVDGAPAATAMLSPGFVGVSVRAGHHRIVMRYDAGNGKLWASLGGVLLLLLLAVAERSGWPARGQRWRLPSVRLPRPWLVAGGLTLLALPVCVPLLGGQVLDGHDGFGYFSRVIEEHQNLANGIALPRWAPDFGWGTGQPFFVFHPPMFYCLAELCHLTGLAFPAAVNLATVLIVLASAGSMFLLARLYFGEAGGWLAAAAYLYAPYFAVEIFVRNALEEFSSFPFMALALYGFGAYALHGRRRHWLLGAAAYGALEFCGFPAALLFSPLLLAFVLFTAWRAASWKLLLKQIGGIAFGLALSLCVWLPAMVERAYVWMERVLDGGWRYSNHLLAPYQLLYSPWGYGPSVPGPHDGMSFALGWSHLLLAVGVCVWLERRGQPGDRWLARFFAAAGAVVCIMMCEQMQWLWDLIPLLQFVVFPWVLLASAAVCLAMLAGALGPVLDGLGRWRKPAFAAALALLIVPNLGHLRPRSYRDVDMSFWTPQQISARGWETTSTGEVTPRAVEVTPLYDSAAALVEDGDARIRQLTRTPFSWSAAVTAKTASTVRLSTAWYPGWEMRLDGHAADSGPTPVTGLIRIAVPPGEHRAEAAWRGTALEHWSDGASLAALALWLALWLRGGPRRKAAPSPEE
jgi:hypothetical protein